MTPWAVRSRLSLACVIGLALACGAPPDSPAPAPPAQPLAAPAPPAPADAPISPYDPPPGVEDRLLAMTSLELFSVDPGHRHDHGFRGYGVLGSVVVHDRAAIQAMIRGLFDNFRPPPELRQPFGVGAAYCFEPRLGVRATDAAGTVDLLICYECGRMHAWSPEFRESWILYFGLGQDALRAPLLAAGVPFAPDAAAQSSAGPRVQPKPSAVDGPRDAKRR